MNVDPLRIRFRKPTLEKLREIANAHNTTESSVVRVAVQLLLVDFDSLTDKREIAIFRAFRDDHREWKRG